MEHYFDSNPVEISNVDKIEYILKEWISKIEYNQDKYSIKKLPFESDDLMLNRLSIKYDQKTLFKINYFRKYKKSEDNRVSLRGMFTLRAQNEGGELLDNDEAETLSVNDHLEIHYSNPSCRTLYDALMDLLPIRETEKVLRIMELFDVEKSDIIFDSYEKRYILQSPQDLFSWVEDTRPSMYYKYMTLGAFISTLANKSFRMHSIISQSDVTETFYLGDFLCKEYDDWKKKSKTVLDEESTLISSFTSHFNDSYMWNAYAKNGTGVCLGFEPMKKALFHQIQYVDEIGTSLNKYREKAKILKEEGIRIFFKDIEKYHRFVKSNRFEKENEWRLIVDTNQVLETATYDNNYCVVYHDFPFQDNVLPEIGLKLISVDLGPKQPFNNFSILAKKIRSVFGSNVLVNRCG